MSASDPTRADLSRRCETLLMHGGFDFVHIGRSPMNPGLPLGSLPALAWAPDLVLNL
jgi:hypothetical protein